MSKTIDPKLASPAACTSAAARGAVTASRSQRGQRAVSVKGLGNSSTSGPARAAHVPADPSNRLSTDRCY